jgi:ubiquinone biosynthesis protein UbiJ
VTRDFIVKAVRAGKLEYREGSMHGNPYLRVLRSQLELYIAEELGSEHLASEKTNSELRSIKTEMASLKRKLAALETRRAALERKLGS